MYLSYTFLHTLTHARTVYEYQALLIKTSLSYLPPQHVTTVSHPIHPPVPSRPDSLDRPRPTRAATWAARPAPFLFIFLIHLFYFLFISFLFYFIFTIFPFSCGCQIVSKSPFLLPALRCCPCGGVRAPGVTGNLACEL
jgi:hypothetical protein